MEAGMVTSSTLMADISNVINQMQAWNAIVQPFHGRNRARSGGVEQAAKAMAATLSAGLSVSAFVDMFNGSVNNMVPHDLAIQGKHHSPRRSAAWPTSSFSGYEAQTPL